MNKKLKVCAVLDIIIDIVLIVSLICVCHQKKELKAENVQLKQIVEEQSDTILRDEVYIEYLEKVYEEVETELFKGE